MTDLLILGTDTDAGKTTFALLWLAAFAPEYDYWKPVETGDSDSERVRQLVPSAVVHPPLACFRDPVAPLLAARCEDRIVPTAATLVAARPLPRDSRKLLVETFGSPFSPLDETDLQAALIQRLTIPTVLVTPSSVGAIGRTLQTLKALAAYTIHPSSVLLSGPPDAFAAEQIARHWPVAGVFSLQPPTSWDMDGIMRASREQLAVLELIRSRLAGFPNLVSRELAVESHESVAFRSAKGNPFAERKATNEQVHTCHTRPRSTYEIGDLLERDRRHVWHPYTSLRESDAPLVSVAAQDEFLELADGRRVIDAISSWWTILHGHRHPPLMATLAEAMQSIDHVHFAGVTHAHAVALAELLLSTAPWTGGRVFYSDNGSTAVEVALKMAYQYWCHQEESRRTLFLGFEGGYHGDTFGAMSVGRDPVFFGRFEPLLFRTEIVPLSAERLDDALTRHRGEVAAVIVEPLVQGAGGMRMHSPADLRALYEVARGHGVLFIADEVMTGGGRTGPLWAHLTADIAPDLICAAKTLTGGVLPLAATLVSSKLVAAWDTADRSRTFFHGHSFTAHPLACAVAAANWRILTTSPSTAPARMEAAWNQLLDPLRRQPRVREVRVRGTIAAVEVDSPGGYLAEVSRHLRRSCLENDVVVRPLGPVLYAMPPFCTSQASLERIAHAMIQAVASLP
jgi:adenosylmethionine-8-amino-7-oxononanoate aminotransferase